MTTQTQGAIRPTSTHDLSPFASDLHRLERALCQFKQDAGGISEMAYATESDIPFGVHELDKLVTLTAAVETLASIAHGLSVDVWNKAAEQGGR
jgi:3-polyprenyl-4-hydroxybenzoate decarboxylase